MTSEDGPKSCLRFQKEWISLGIYLCECRHLILLYQDNIEIINCKKQCKQQDNGFVVHECEDPVNKWGITSVFRLYIVNCILKKKTEKFLIEWDLVISRNWTFLNCINVEYLVSLILNWQSDILSVLSRLW